MRTGRARLEEWVHDIIENAVDYKEPIVTTQEWVDRIMQDINLGIIAPEPSADDFPQGHPEIDSEEKL